MQYRTELRRSLGVVDAVGIGFGAIVGAGIFVVSGVAAAIAGPALLVGLALAGIAATANALSSAQLAARYPRSGATYEYGYELLRPAAGFAAGWMFLASKIAAAGTVALGLGGYLGALLPGIPARAVAVGAIVLFTALNYVGVRRTSRLNLLIVVTSVGALLLLVAAGAPHVRASNLAPFAPEGAGSVLRAAAILFFAYTGYARIATLGEEVHDPERTIPRAVVITTMGALVLYAAVAFVALGVAGAPTLAATDAPLFAAAQELPGGWVPPAVAVGAVAAMLGVILSQLLGLSRMALAMARRHDLPAWLDRVHPRFGVPHVAILGVGTIAAVVAATGTLAAVAETASFAILVYYGIANVAALRMSPGDKRYPDVVPWVGLTGCVLLALSLSLRVMAGGLALLAAGFLVRALVRATARATEWR